MRKVYLLFKTHISSHTRHLANGKVVNVIEHEDRRKSLQDAARNLFGDTPSASKGSFILSDGYYVLRPSNAGGHGDIISIYPDGHHVRSNPDPRGSALRHFLNNSGAARVYVTGNDFYVETAAKLTSSQIESIVMDAEGKRLTIEIVDANGKTKKSFNKTGWTDRDVKAFLAKNEGLFAD